MRRDPSHPLFLQAPVPLRRWAGALLHLRRRRRAGKTWPGRTFFIAVLTRSWQNLSDMIPQAPAARAVLDEQFFVFKGEHSPRCG
jgi:hypothetical protein